MKPRKIILLSACVVLLAIAVVQVIGSHKDPVKILTIKEDIDEIRIARPDGNLNLKKRTNGWVVGDKEYSAMESTCDGLVDTFQTIRILDKVTKTDNDDALAKYNLDSTNVYTVTVYSEGNLLRTFYVGKTSSTNSQTYMRIDNSSDVYLVNGSIQNDCSKTVDNVRSKIVYELDKNEINTISVTPANPEDGETWALTRSGDGTVWSVSYLPSQNVSADGADEETDEESSSGGKTGVADIEIDPEKATSWFQSCSAVSCLEWLSDDEEVPGEKLVTGTITLSGRVLAIDLYRTVDEEEEEEFWGKTSELPYAFKLPKYVVQKFQKNPEDFSK